MNCNNENVLVGESHSGSYLTKLLISLETCGNCSITSSGLHLVLENQTLIKQGEQIFIPDNVPHAPYNLSDKKCVWVVVHSSGDDQDELIRTEELDYVLESYEQREP